jgi:hypothetical protein
MSELVIQDATTFDYNTLDERKADWLRRKTDRIRGLITITAAAAVKIGIELITIKKKLRRGEFVTWMKSELPWSLSKSNRFMRIARVFGGAERVDLFTPTALYLLCWPSAPESARRQALDIVKSGHPVSASKARELILIHQPLPPTGEPAKVDAPPSRKREKSTIPVAPSVVDSRWDDLQEVFAEYDTIHISRGEDSDDISITAYPVDQSKSIVHFSRDTLEDCLKAVLGAEVVIRCSRCRKKKSPSCFCVNASISRGRNNICRQCESKRRIAGRKRKKATPEPQQSPESVPVLPPDAPTPESTAATPPPNGEPE